MRALACDLIRGGSSRAAFFARADLPTDPQARDALLVATMGGPDALQVDGIGGGHPLTSKVAVVAPAADPDIDIDYLFLQVDPQRQTVSDAQNCGNILAGVGVYALHHGLVKPADEITRVRVRMLNGSAMCELELQTPGGVLQVTGDARVDGVPGSGAPIVCNYEDIAGATCGALLPTGRTVDEITGLAVTCIDNGMPVVVLRAADVGVSGNESPEVLEANESLRARLETLRLAAGPLMQLGDVTDKSVPKLCLVSAPQAGGALTTRTFIPHVCHRSIGVLGAVSVATAARLPGTPAADIARIDKTGGVHIEHPEGSLEVRLAIGADGQVERAGVVRTARLLFSGQVYVQGVT